MIAATATFRRRHQVKAPNRCGGSASARRAPAAVGRPERSQVGFPLSQRLRRPSSPPQGLRWPLSGYWVLDANIFGMWLNKRRLLMLGSPAKACKIQKSCDARAEGSVLEGYKRIVFLLILGLQLRRESTIVKLRLRRKFWG